MKKNFKFRENIPAVISAALLITLVAVVYIRQLNQTVSYNINSTVSELATHDQNTIQTCIEDTWEELEYIESKFTSYSCETVEDIETLMNIECSNSQFSHLYLVADDGKVYTDKLLTYDPSKDGQIGRVNLLPYFDGDSDRIVSRFDDIIPTVGLTKESILYGIRSDDLVIGGINVKGLVGISDISTMQDRLIIDSFEEDGESRGYSCVIDMNGDYIVNIQKTVYLSEKDNFFDLISSGEKADFSIDELESKMEARRTFSFSYTDSSGNEKIIYCKPFNNENIDWYFLLSVQKTVFNEQNKDFLVLSMAMLVCIVIVVTVLLSYVLISRSKAIEANAEASATSHFLANMSHEIRTPLNGIIGLIYLAEKDIDNGSTESVGKRLTKAESTANYLLSLINNILDITKLQSGKVEPSRDVISPEIVADAVWSMQKSILESRDIDFRFEKSVSVPWIIGDDILLKRVLMNIVGNAGKFTESGGKITLTLTQERISDTRVTTYFVCEDTGCGMSSEYLEHIWDSFSQEHHRGENGMKGTGLGMPISKLLMNAMDGDILVESTLDVGSKFTVVLNSEIAEKAPVTVDTESLGETGAMIGDRPVKVLLAEDNELNAEILMEILHSEGFEVVHAENGRQAVDIFRASNEFEFDVILMDMQMPVMDGCHATKEIRSMGRADSQTVQIFACTANSFKEDRNRAFESGMDDFLPKPVDVNKLLMKIRGEDVSSFPEDTQHI